MLGAPISPLWGQKQTSQLIRLFYSDVAGGVTSLPLSGRRKVASPELRDHGRPQTPDFGGLFIDGGLYHDQLRGRCAARGAPGARIAVCCRETGRPDSRTRTLPRLLPDTSRRRAPWSHQSSTVQVL